MISALVLGLIDNLVIRPFNMFIWYIHHMILTPGWETVIPIIEEEDMVAIARIKGTLL